MERDSKGRFTKRSTDSELIRKMELNLGVTNAREIPIVDNRKKLTYTTPKCLVKENKDEELIEKAVNSINRLGLNKNKELRKENIRKYCADAKIETVSEPVGYKPVKVSDGTLYSTVTKPETNVYVTKLILSKEFYSILAEDIEYYSISRDEIVLSVKPSIDSLYSNFLNDTTNDNVIAYLYVYKTTRLKFNDGDSGKFITKIYLGNYRIKTFYFENGILEYNIVLERVK